MFNVVGWYEDVCLCFIMLDCCCVVVYMLEIDVGMDDFLMESSILQLYVEMLFWQWVNILQINDDFGQVQWVVCGWIVSIDIVVQIVVCISVFFCGVDIYWCRFLVCWYNLDYLEVFWFMFIIVQKQNLLGEGVWIVYDGNGRFKIYVFEYEVVLSLLLFFVV